MKQYYFPIFENLLHLFFNFTVGIFHSLQILLALVLDNLFHFILSMLDALVQNWKISPPAIFQGCGDPIQFVDQQSSMITAYLFGVAGKEGICRLGNRFVLAEVPVVALGVKGLLNRREVQLSHLPFFNLGQPFSQVVKVLTQNCWLALVGPEHSHCQVLPDFLLQLRRCVDAMMISVILGVSLATLLDAGPVAVSACSDQHTAFAYHVGNIMKSIDGFDNK